MWYLYILECSDKSLYTGITTNLNRRLEEHNSSDLGARYTRGRRPVKMVYSAVYENRAQASVAEAKIKKLSKHEKKALFRNKRTSG